MKILLYSYVFSPNIGGVETVSEMLANGFTTYEHECIVITETPEAATPKIFPFKVIRQPKADIRKKLVEWADIVVCNGANLALQPWVWLKKKPFVWIHVGYQASCIDGLGWVDGTKAPIKPFDSILFHFRRSGFIFALKEGAKLYIRSFFAHFFVSKNVAITRWMYDTLPFKNQVLIYNPFPLEKFSKPSRQVSKEYDFIFLGRLVSEKGVPVLLNALAEAIRISGKSYRLLIVGSGNCREKYETLASFLNLHNNVFFAGKKSGQELVDLIYTAPIAIVPSEWYEPMGGVALELLSAKRSIIVSEQGGLKECVGKAGLTFRNGDYHELAEKMILLESDEELRNRLKNNIKETLEPFLPDKLIKSYIQLFKDLIVNSK